MGKQRLPTSDSRSRGRDCIQARRASATPGSRNLSELGGLRFVATKYMATTRPIRHNGWGRARLNAQSAQPRYPKPCGNESGIGIG